MTDVKIIKMRYQELISIINKHNLLYHSYDSPEISDSEYDNLYKELKIIESNNPKIIKIMADGKVKPNQANKDPLIPLK